MPQALLILQHAFMAWMLIDAIRRGAERRWFWIIFIPFGEWYYFFMVKIHTPEMAWLKAQFHYEKPQSLEGLRYRFEQTPSLANRLRLGQALHDEGSYDEGAELFSGVLARQPESREALLGLGLCSAGRGDDEGAVGSLERLIELDRAYGDYQPWLHLTEALWRLGRCDDALGLLERLVATSPRLGHSVALAQFQIEADQPEPARKTLWQALEHHSHAPRFDQRNNRAWARRAKKMLKRLGGPVVVR
jgi:hypothetical protein